MLIAEPPDLYFARAAERERQHEQQRQEFFRQVANPKEHPDGWDELVMAYFIARPRDIILIVRAANALAKQRSYACKKDREQAKILILRTIGRLVQKRRLTRVRRKFVRINAGEVVTNPIIPLRQPVPLSGKIPAGTTVGSTNFSGAIHPAIFT